MGLKALLHWQWQGYRQYHRSKTNLAIHLVAVPLFIVAFVFLIVSLVSFHFPTLLWSSCALLVAILLQAIGHKKEALPPEKFTGPGNFIFRLLFEQFITFPRFVWKACHRYLKEILN